VASAIAAGLLLGAIYGMLSLGFNLSVGVVRILNFAHGGVVVWSMYLISVLASTFGVHPFLVAPLIVAGAFVVGYVSHRVLVERILDASEESQVLFGLGMLLVLMHGAQMVFSHNARLTRVGGLDGSVPFLGGRLQTGLIAGGALAVATCLVVAVVIRRSDLGRKLRSCADNREGARLIGLPVAHLNSVAAGISAVLAAVAGMCLLPIVILIPERSLQYTLLALVIVIIGGLGNLLGSIVGGVVVGLVTIVGQQYLSGTMTDAILYACVFVFLLWKPLGLLGSPLGAK